MYKLNASARDRVEDNINIIIIIIIREASSVKYIGRSEMKLIIMHRCDVVL